MEDLLHNKREFLVRCAFAGMTRTKVKHDRLNRIQHESESLIREVLPLDK